MAAASCIAWAMISSRRRVTSPSASRSSASRLQLGFGDDRTCLGFGGRAHLGCDRGRVGARLLEQAGHFGLRLGAHDRALVGRGRVRFLADLGAGGVGRDELELRGEARLAQRGDGLASQALDRLLRASALLPARRLLVRCGLGHRGPGYETGAPKTRIPPDRK